MSILGAARVLILQRTKGFDTPTEPHFDAPTSEFFRTRIAKTELYLEYGAGGSTILADRCKVPTTTVESDPFYADAVKAGLTRETTVNIIVPNMGLTGEWGYPLFASDKKGRRYVDAGFQLGAFPDFILVDGRYRIACVLEAARRANAAHAQATLLVDDYINRSAYHYVEQYLGPPEMVGRSAVFEIGTRPVTTKAVAEVIGIAA